MSEQYERLMEELARQSERAVEMLLEEEAGRQEALAELAARQEAALRGLPPGGEAGRSSAHGAHG